MNVLKKVNMMLSDWRYFIYHLRMLISCHASCSSIRYRKDRACSYKNRVCKRKLCGDISENERSIGQCINADIYNEKKKDAHCWINIFGELHCPVEVPFPQFESAKQENAQVFVVRWSYVEKNNNQVVHVGNFNQYDIADPDNVVLYETLKKRSMCKFLSAKIVECNMQPITEKR